MATPQSSAQKDHHHDHHRHRRRCSHRRQHPRRPHRRRRSHRFVYWLQCIYSGDPILLSQFVLPTVHLQWRSHPTVPICIQYSLPEDEKLYEASDRSRFDSPEFYAVFQNIKTKLMATKCDVTTSAQQ